MIIIGVYARGCQKLAKDAGPFLVPATPRKIRRRNRAYRMLSFRPLAGVFKFALKLTLAVFLAKWLELVPMACISGVLLFVSYNMVKKGEIMEVWRHNNFHAFLMVFTAITVAKRSCPAPGACPCARARESRRASVSSCSPSCR